MTPNRSNTSRRWTAALAGTAVAISGVFVSTAAVADADAGNIPETAVASGRLNTLVAAVQAAGLAEARKAEQARVRPSKKVGGDPATVEETGKLMTQKI